MSPNPEDDPSPDNNNPSPPPDPLDDNNPAPPSDEASTIHRLQLLWEQWERIRAMLLCMAKSSGLPPTEGELAVDEVLDRLVKLWISDHPPDSPCALARVSMRRLLGRIRKKGSASCIGEDMKLATPYRLRAAPPDIKDFWQWVEAHAQTMESQLTALQWQTLMATRDAQTIDSAASRCSQLPINYRNTTQRLGKKISKIIQDGSVPPPLI